MTHSKCFGSYHEVPCIPPAAAFPKPKPESANFKPEILNLDPHQGTLGFEALSMDESRGQRRLLQSLVSGAREAIGRTARNIP